MTTPVRRSPAASGVRRKPGGRAGRPESTVAAGWPGAPAGIDSALTPSAAALRCSGSMWRIGDRRRRRPRAVRARARRRAEDRLAAPAADGRTPGSRARRRARAPRRQRCRRGAPARSSPSSRSRRLPSQRAWPSHLAAAQLARRRRRRRAAPPARAAAPAVRREDQRRARRIVLERCRARARRSSARPGRCPGPGTAVTRASVRPTGAAAAPIRRAAGRSGSGRSASRSARPARSPIHQVAQVKAALGRRQRRRKPGAPRGDARGDETARQRSRPGSAAMSRGCGQRQRLAHEAPHQRRAEPACSAAPRPMIASGATPAPRRCEPRSARARVDARTRRARPPPSIRQPKTRTLASAMPAAG